MKKCTRLGLYPTWCTIVYLQSEHEKQKLLLTEEYKETVQEIPWLYLTCDLPAQPLYPDELQVTGRLGW